MDVLLFVRHRDARAALLVVHHSQERPMSAAYLEEFCEAIERTRRPDGRAAITAAARLVWPHDDDAMAWATAFLTLENALSKGYLALTDPEARPVTHPTDPVAAMREACARRVEKAYIDRPAYNGSDSPEWVLANEMRRVAAAIRALPLPACATGDDAAHEGGLMARVENHLRGQVGLPPAPSRPADDGERTALSLLADARKCVALVNVNGYYDVWLARCDRVLATAKRPADDAVARATERVVEAAKAWRGTNTDDYRLNMAVDALLAAERAAKGGEKPCRKCCKVDPRYICKHTASRDGGAAKGNNEKKEV